MHSSLFDLRNKTILCTGANGWLAGGMLEGLASHGARLILLDSNPGVEKTAASLNKKFKVPAAGIAVDMFDRGEYLRTLQGIAKEARVDAVINNAFSFGSSNVETGREGDWESLSDLQWQTAFESGVLWAVQTIKPFLPSMRKKRGGSIINICSMYSLIAPNPKMYQGPWKKYLSQPTYTAVKTGLLGLTRYWASFLAPHGIRANAIAPGAFSKPATAPAFVKKLRDVIPMGRIGKPQDLAGAAVFLASDASSYMTGQCLTVDGGWTVR
ncbi:MAG: SDR family oxidoreductase [Candidatus Omnitrophota bacterium]|nr:SDR family oxidoreductase [Candidatus Omnitrophota bacterium]